MSALVGALRRAEAQARARRQRSIAEAASSGWEAIAGARCSASRALRALCHARLPLSVRLALRGGGDCARHKG